MQELPMVMDCSLSFTVIHRFAPQTGLNHYITNPFMKQYFNVRGEEPVQAFDTSGIESGLDLNSKFSKIKTPKLDLGKSFGAF